MQVGGRTLLAHVVDAVEACAAVEAFVLTVPQDGEEDVASAARSPKLASLVAGGRERQDSVAAGLAAIPAEFQVVVVHDVARPFATPALYEAVIAALDEPVGGRTADGAVPLVPGPDTLKRVDDGIVLETLDRTKVLAAQTPQAFRREALEEAHRMAREQGFVATDDAALLERAGFRVVAVVGEPLNFKVTRPEDLARAEAVTRRG